VFEVGPELEYNGMRVLSHDTCPDSLSVAAHTCINVWHGILCVDEMNFATHTPPRLELHQRELETKVTETTDLTGSVLMLREELAALRRSSIEEMSAERKVRAAAETAQRDAESEARAASLKWQQEDAAYQLSARLLQGEIDNRKQELARSKQWAEETIAAGQQRMSEQRQRYEERLLSEKEKADIEVRAAQERARTAYAQLEVMRTDTKQQYAELHRTMDQTIATITSAHQDEKKAFETRLTVAKADAKVVFDKLLTEQVQLMVEDKARHQILLTTAGCSSVLVSRDGGASVLLPQHACAYFHQSRFSEKFTS
jgi:hypothetical protein